MPPARVWLDPHAGWQDTLYERLLEQRIVLASGVLDDAAATRLSAQLLTLDAEGTGPIRLELQNLQAELPAALTVMGVLDVIRAEIRDPRRRRDGRRRARRAGLVPAPCRVPQRVVHAVRAETAVRRHGDGRDRAGAAGAPDG